jgi:hypothetical protein
MTGGIVVRGGGAGKNEQAGLASVVDLSPYPIPDRRLHLPLVEQNGRRIREKAIRRQGDRSLCIVVFVESDHRFGDLGCRRRLTAGFWTLDQHCADGVQSATKLGISDAGKIRGHALILRFA